MSRTYLVVPDPHAEPGVDNSRADYLAQLIIDVKPDVVVNLGDAADMSSLSSYDKGKRSFQGKSYKRDIESHLDFQERMWAPVKARKKRMPWRVVLEGNHENRIERALDLSPELQETIGFRDYDFESHYDEVHRYKGGTPGIAELDGIMFAHYFITGVSGRPIGGERPAHMLLAKNSASCIQGHTHVLDFATRRTVSGRTINAGVLGCYHDHIPSWAGNIGQLWRAGVAVLHDVENGEFDFEWISLRRLEKAYGDDRQTTDHDMKVGDGEWE